jgi:hypothetical protein
MKIYLDDNRETPPGWTRVYNVREFKDLVEKAIADGDEIEGISFDNDLGEPGLENEGRSALKWLMNQHPGLMKEGLIILVHTDNSEARDAMAKDYRYWREHIDELIEAKDRPDPWLESDKMK